MYSCTITSNAKLNVFLKKKSEADHTTSPKLRFFPDFRAHCDGKVPYRVAKEQLIETYFPMCLTFLIDKLSSLYLIMASFVSTFKQTSIIYKWMDIIEIYYISPRSQSPKNICCQSFSFVPTSVSQNPKKGAI